MAFKKSLVGEDNCYFFGVPQKVGRYFRSSYIESRIFLGMKMRISNSLLIVEIDFPQNLMINHATARVNLQSPCIERCWK
jgi:hypothetical protein